MDVALLTNLIYFPESPQISFKKHHIDMKNMNL